MKPKAFLITVLFTAFIASGLSNPAIIFAQSANNTSPVRRVIIDEEEVVSKGLVVPSESSRLPYAVAGLFFIAAGTLAVYFYRRHNTKSSHGHQK